MDTQNMTLAVIPLTPIDAYLRHFDAGVQKGSAPSPPPGFLTLVDGRKHSWWIFGSVPHQKKPRLLVSMCYT